jgi:hypothetical protein
VHGFGHYGGLGQVQRLIEIATSPTGRFIRLKAEYERRPVAWRSCEFLLALYQATNINPTIEALLANH